MGENNIIKIIGDSEVQEFLGYDRSKGLDFNFMLKSGWTLLTTAVRTSDLANITSIIQNGAKIDQREEGGATPLLLAVYLNRLQVVKHLVGYGASIHQRDSYNTPLSLATRKEHVDIVKFLVDKGAKITDVDAEGKSPLFWAIETGKLKILQALISRGIPKDSKSASGDSPLIVAIKSGASKEIIQCLLKNGASMNDSTLLWLAKKGAVDIMRVLIENGADANVVGDDGNTPLATAVRYNKIAVVKYLAALGVNICKVGKKGKSPLQWAVLNQDMLMVEYLLDHGAAYIANSVFLTAIETKNLQIVQLLLERGADRKRLTTQTPLAKALEVASLEIATYLLDNGASFANDLNNNETAHLVTFIEQKNHELVKLLGDKGAKLEKTGGCGNTPLTKAIRMEDFEMVRYIVAQQANVNQPNRFNLTPLAVAAEMKDFRTFQFLVETGANLDHDPKKNDPQILHYYDIAVEEIRHKLEIQRELSSNQEDAEDKKIEPVEEVEDTSVETLEKLSLSLVETRYETVSEYFQSAFLWQFSFSFVVLMVAFWFMEMLSKVVHAFLG